MKPPISFKRVVATLLTLLVLRTVGVQAQTSQTWTNNGAAYNLSNAVGLWQGATNPASGDSWVFANTSNEVLTNNFSNGFTVSGITFNAGTGVDVIGGNAIKLKGSIVNNSTNLETLNFAITNSGSDTITATSGGIRLGGLVSGTGTLTFNGSGTTTLLTNMIVTGITVSNSGNLTANNQFYLNGTNGGVVFNNTGTFNSTLTGGFRMLAGTNTANFLAGMSTIGGINIGTAFTNGINFMNVYDGATLTVTNIASIGYTGGVTNVLTIKSNAIFTSRSMILGQIVTNSYSALTNYGFITNNGPSIWMNAQSGTNGTSRIIQAAGTFVNKQTLYIGGGNQNGSNNYVAKSSALLDVMGGVFSNVGTVTLGYQGFNNTNTFQVDGGMAYVGNLNVGASFINTNNPGNIYGNINTVNLNGGTLLVAGNLTSAGTNQTNIFNWNGSTVGVGTVTANSGSWSGGSINNGTLYNSNGTLAPGDIGKAGRTVINGNYVQGSSGTLTIDISGATAANLFQMTNSGYYDILTINGNATLAGTLSLSSLGSLNAPSYTFLSVTNGTISGTFDQVTGLPSDYRLVYTDTTVSLDYAVATILYQPTNQLISLGQTASFTVSAQGYGLTYQWMKDGIALAGQTNATLSLANAQSNSVGYYSCAVSDSFGNSVTSSNVALEIPGVPFWKWQGMVLSYSFSSSLNDQSIQGNNAVNYGTTFTNNRLGTPDGAISVSTTQYIISQSKLGISGNQPRTISLWMYATTDPSWPNGALVSWGTNNQSGQAQMLFYSPYKMYGNWDITSDGFYAGSGVQIQPSGLAGAWHHIVYTYSNNPSCSEFYLDGNLLTNFGFYSNTPLNTLDSEVLINNSCGQLNRGINGAISDVHIYNRTLSSNEVQNLYSQESGWEGTNASLSSTNGLVAWYPFNGNFIDATGNTTFNNSGASIGAGPTAGVTNALKFDYGQYGTVTGLGPYISNAVTVSGWYYYNAGIMAPMEYGSGFKTVMYSGTLPDGSNPTFRINGQVSQNQSQLHFQINLGESALGTVNPAYLINTGQWYYVTVVDIAGPNPLWQFYVNGTLIESGTNKIPTTLNFNYAYGLGCSLEGGGYYWGTGSQGGIASWRVYNRALSSNEVSQLYTVESGSNSATGSGMVITNFSGKLIGNVTLPNKLYGTNVTSIGDSALAGQSNMTSLTISTNVTSIGAGAFSNCASLGTIIIPDSIVEFGTNVFAGCTGLTNIVASPSMLAYLASNASILGILQQSQTITFPALSPVTYSNGATVTLAASASSGLPVSYTSYSTNVSISGNQVTLLGVGNATIVASQDGDMYFNSAAAVTNTINIIPIPSLSLFPVGGSNSIGFIGLPFSDPGAVVNCNGQKLLIYSSQNPIDTTTAGLKVMNYAYTNPIGGTIASVQRNVQIISTNFVMQKMMITNSYGDGFVGCISNTYYINSYAGGLYFYRDGNINEYNINGLVNLNVLIASEDANSSTIWGTGNDINGYYKIFNINDSSTNIFSVTNFPPNSYPSIYGTFSNGIYGTYSDTTIPWNRMDNQRSYFFSSNGWVEIRFPGSAGTTVTGTDSKSLIYGYYPDYSKPMWASWFVYKDGQYTKLNMQPVPNACVNGVLAGHVQINSYMAHAYLYDGTNYINRDVPGSISTFIRGYDGWNTWGEWMDSNNVSHGYIYDGVTVKDAPNNISCMNGIYQQSIYTNGSLGVNIIEGTNSIYINFPNSAYGTTINGCNDSTLYGSYNDGTENHTFLAFQADSNHVAPVISINGSNPISCTTDHYGNLPKINFQGATVSDPVDGSIQIGFDYNYLGNLSGTFTPWGWGAGQYTNYYYYIDSQGYAAASAPLIINVAYPPDQISLTCSNPLNVTVGSYNSDPVASVTDPIDGTINITPSGFVNGNIPGSYSLTYSFTNSQGTVAPPVTLMVNVTSTPISLGSNTGVTSYTNTASDGVVRSGDVTLSGNATIFYTNPNATIQSAGAVSISGTNNLISLAGGYLNGTTNILISGTSLTTYYGSSIAVTGPAVGNGTLTVGSSYTNAGSILSLSQDNYSLYLTVTQNTNPLSQGLVLYYPLNGSLMDQSGQGNNGVNYGSSYTTNRMGEYNGALQVGYNSGITSSREVSIPTGSDFTVSIWMRPSEDPSWPAGSVVSLMERQYGDVIGGRVAALNYRPYYQEGVQIDAYYQGAAVTTTPSNLTGSWNQLLYTYQASNGQYSIYLNGVLQTLNFTNSGSLDLVNTLLTVSGVSGSGDTNGGGLPRGINGAVSDIRIYNRALSGSEIAQVYAQEAGNLDSDGDGLPDAYEQGYGRYEIIQGNFTWEQAKADAESHTNAYGIKGHLATITSDSEWAMIRNQLGGSLQGKNWWIGGTDANHEGNWGWITGEAWSYNRWQPGEPSNGGGVENYLTIDSRYGDFTWNDVDMPNGGQSGYLLEYGYPSDPYKADTDGDGYDDLTEQLSGTDPNNPLSYPGANGPVVSVDNDLYVGSNTPNNSLAIGAGTSTYRNTYVGYQSGSSNNILNINASGPGPDVTLQNSNNVYIGYEGSGNTMRIGGNGDTFTGTNISGIVWYVAADGNDSSSGSVSSPFASIQQAINSASNGDVILVKPGNYSGAGNNNINFYGKSVTLSSTAGPKETVINLNHGQAIIAESGETTNTRVVGLTFTNGYVQYSGDWNGDGIVRVSGAGTSLFLENCIFTANSTIATYVTSSLGIFMERYGASNSVIKNCLFYGNSVGGGGWTGVGGGGAYVIGGSPQVISCTVADNNLYSSVGDWGNYGGGIHFAIGTGGVVDSSIVYNNSPTHLPPWPGFVSTSAQISASVSAYCDSLGGVSGLWGSNASGIGILTNDPLFKDPGVGDYGLQLNSPARNAGNPSLSANPDGTRADMGFRADLAKPSIGSSIVLAFNGFIGMGSNSSNNQVLINGSNSTWSNSGTLTVGNLGSGNALVVSNGGSVIAGGSGWPPSISVGVDSNSSNNSIVITQPGSKLVTPGNLFVGYRGGGNALVISEGGVVSDQFAMIGNFSANASNSALVTGAGSTWNNNMIMLGVNASLVISNGGTVNTVWGLGTNIGGTTVVTGVGSSFNASSNLFIFGAGQAVTVSNGASLNDVGASVDGYAWQSNSMLGIRVTGNGSVWNNGGADLNLGNWSGNIALEISNGGVVNNANAAVGYNTYGYGAPSNNLLLVTGVGSLWSNSGSLTLGGANLTVANGANVWTTNLVIAAQTGAVATINYGRLGQNDTAGSINADTTTFGVGSWTANFNQTDLVSIGIDVSGNGVVNQLGSGTTVLTGSNAAFAGPLNILNGTFMIGDGTTTGGSPGTGNILNNSTLVIYPAAGDLYTVPGVISGTGNVVLTGATTILSGSNTYSGGTLLSNAGVVVANNSAFGIGTITQVADSGLVAGIADLATTNAIDVVNSTLAINNNGNNWTIGGCIDGGGQLAFYGTGTTTLSASNTMTGPVNVYGGLLNLTGSLPSGGTVNLQSYARMNLTGVAGNVNVLSSASLSGTGSANAVVVSAAGTITPGTDNLPGTLTLSSALWAPGGNYNWVLNDASGSAGAGYSTLTISGLLDLSQLGATNRFAINISAGSNGVPLNFSGLVSTNWTIATFGAITNFSSANFTLNTTAVNGAVGLSLTNLGNFSLTQSGNALQISYRATTPVSVTYIGGSAALRSTVMPAITNFIAANHGSVIASDNAFIGSAHALVASYTNAGGQPCCISVRLTGSEAGIQSAASPAGTNLIAFAPYNPVHTGLGSLTTSDYTVLTNAKVVLSDTYQSASRFNGTYGGVTYASLAAAPGSASGGVIGAITYNWVASSNFPAYATNVTGQFARLLLTSGKAPLALMTGRLSDSNNGCYLVGRNIDSGARITTFASTGFGVLTSTKQYALGTNFATSSAGATILGNPATDTNKIFLWPVESVDGISSGSIGNGGYGSGITLCSLMTNALARGTNLVVVANSTSNGVLATNVRSAYTGTNYLIGYALRRDAEAKTNDGLVLLGYDGKANTTNNVANGGYTFWGYEHLYMGVNTNADDVAVATGLSGTIPSFITAPDIPIRTMKVQRTTDGGVVVPNY